MNGGCSASTAATSIAFMSEHPLDVLFTAARDGESVVVPPGWGQGRATFGGVVAGAMLSRVLAGVDLPEQDVRAMTINFVGPVEAGDARVTAEVLRQGKSATQVEARVTQADASGVESVRAVALVTIGAARPSSLSLAASPLGKDLPEHDSLTPIPYIEGVTPEFIARLDMRLAKGHGPFSGGADGDMHGYMSFREPTDDFGLAHLVALVDCWPPAAGQMLTKVVPMSTMTWTMDFVAPVTGTGADRWWYEVTTDAAHDGYGHTAARVYTASGEPVVISRQTVAVFG